MGDQLSLFVAAPPAAVSSQLPAVVVEIITAARAISFSMRIVRWHWGIGIGPKRRWMPTGDCCCALSALILAKKEVAEPRETSAICASERLLGCSANDVYSFLHGFDGIPAEGSDSKWYKYGELVAKEVVT